MQYRVPQFIEEESKIVGPLTLKQSMVIGLAGGIIFTMYFSFGETNLFLFLVLSGIIAGGALASAFLKIDGRPFTEMITHIMNFSIMPRLYLWKRKETPVFLKVELKTPLDLKDEKDPFKGLELRKGKLNELQNKIDIS
ncbi:MAG: PrgI family protein [Candidatus Pacebacteria bacterium]|nr:PrgI family protein [Candidatus Paceibacterota bacterium]MDD4333971.1 PrgI family protein [Candidatus Paceibacterota bacterium]